MNVPAGEVKSNKSKRRDGYGLQLNTCFCLFRDTEREKLAQLALNFGAKEERKKIKNKQKERKENENVQCLFRLYEQKPGSESESERPLENERAFNIKAPHQLEIYAFIWNTGVTKFQF